LGFFLRFISSWRVFQVIFVQFLVAQGYNNFNILIIGAGKVGKSLAEEIQKRPWLGFKVVGYLDDFQDVRDQKEGPPILGKLDDFQTVARHEFIHQIFISGHVDENRFLTLLEQAKELGLAIRVIPHGFELMSGEFSKINIGIIPVLEYSDVKARRKQAGKRVFDLVVTTAATLALLPLFAFIAILIKLESRGPVFHVSRRYGRGGRIFHMYKFRSMEKDAHKKLLELKNQNEVDGPIFKIRNDPRITRIGKFLRKYSLDELPQLFNVVIGDMSLVGPRPLPIDQIEKEDLRQLQRLEVRPGITGLWQIRGRSDLSFQRLVKWDVWYINNWSLWLDLRILFQTVPVVLYGRGAY
jgi:exopolysaccharide biosynthesis polyprenyl glycosylphosphotransferase